MHNSLLSVGSLEAVASSERADSSPLEATPRSSLASSLPNTRKRKLSTRNNEGRTKTTRACDSCKQKKARCNGMQPCDRCIKQDAECLYNSSYARGRPPTPPRATSTPENTPSRIAALQPVEYAHSTPLTMRVETNHGPRTHLTQPAEYESHPDTSLDVPTSQLPTSHTSSRNTPEPISTDLEGHYLGPTSGVTFLRRAWSRLNQTHESTLQADDINGGESQQASIFAFGDRPFPKISIDTLTLPPIEKAREYVRVYFDFAVVTYRFLHRGTVDQWVEGLYTEDSKLSSGKKAVVFSIFSMSSLHPRETGDAHSTNSQESDAWYAATQQELSSETGSLRLETVQARLSLCLYLLATSRANQSWYLFGTTCQLILALGLHRRRAPGTLRKDGDFIHNECRKRVFWSAYTLDKYLSIILGRPRVLNEEEVDQELPEAINDEDMTPSGVRHFLRRVDCVMDAAIFHARLGRILGEISRDVYTVRHVGETERFGAAQKCNRELEAWKDSLPPILGMVHPSSLIPLYQRQNHVLTMGYSHAIIHANRLFLLNNFRDLSRRPDAYKEPLRENVHKCIQAARDVVDLVNELVEQKAMFQAFWWTQYAAFCAVMVIYVYTIQQHRIVQSTRTEAAAVGYDWALRSKLMDEGLFAQAELCQRHIAQMTEQNAPSRRYSIILEELRLEVHRQAQAADDRGHLCDAQPPGPVGDDTILPGKFDSQVDPYRPNPAEQPNDIYPSAAGGPDVFSFDASLPMTEDWTAMGWSELDSWVYSNMAEDDTLLLS